MVKSLILSFTIWKFTENYLCFHYCYSQIGLQEHLLIYKPEGLNSVKWLSTPEFSKNSAFDTLRTSLSPVSGYTWRDDGCQVGTWMRGSMDGEAYACLLNILAPEHYSPATLDAKDPIHRAKLVFDHTERMDCKRYSSPKDIVEGSPNLSLAFDCSNIPSKEWVLTAHTFSVTSSSIKGGGKGQHYQVQGPIKRPNFSSRSHP